MVLPELIAELRAEGPEVARRNGRLGWISAAVSLPAACVVAPFVYRLPELVPLLLALLLPAPACYLGCFSEEALRADGRIRECVGLGLARLASSLIALPALASQFGLWGLVLGVAALSLILPALARWRLLAHHPGLLPVLRP